MVCLFCAVNFTGDIKNVQISTLLSKTKIVAIWTKFFISRVMLKAKKGIPQFGNFSTRSYFVITICRILLLKLGWQTNAANYIKNQRRRSRRLATVMFRGTPCIQITKYNMAVNNKALEIGKWKYNDQEFTKCFRAIYL